MLMLRDPHVLIMDEPSNHLDPESVEALAYGLKNWNGTVVMVSHDVHLIRLLEGTCYVLVETEGKLRRLEGGIDSFLKILGAKEIQ
jgi:ATP-binding cassette subfamily F protein 3